MCGACRSTTTDRAWNQEGIGESLGDRRRGRSALAAACTRVFGPPMRVTSYPTADVMSVHSPTGRTLSASTLAEVTAAVLTLTGRLPDPLDTRAPLQRRP